MLWFSIVENKEKNFKIPYFAFVIAILNLMTKVYMFQISIMNDTEVCEPKEESWVVMEPMTLLIAQKLLTGYPSLVAA